MATQQPHPATGEGRLEIGRWNIGGRTAIFCGLVLGIAAAAFVGARFYDREVVHPWTDDAHATSVQTGVSAGISGVIRSMRVRENDEVRAGQIVAVMDDAEDRSAFAVAQAHVLAAEAHVRSLESLLAYESARHSDEVAASQDDFHAAAAARGVTAASADAARSRAVQEELAQHRAQGDTTHANALLAARADDVKRTTTELDIYRKLSAQGYVSRLDLTEKESAVEQARAQLVGARADAGSARVAYDEAAHKYREDIAMVAAANQENAAAGAHAESVSHAIGSRSSLGQAESRRADVSEARATLAGARADLRIAAERISKDTVRSPVDGWVVTTVVGAGQGVSAIDPIVVVAPTDSLYIEANFKESQIRHIAIGDRAAIHVDAYPDRPLVGRVTALGGATVAARSALPDVSGNYVKIVQRLPVRIEVSPADAQTLRNGLSVEVRIIH